MQPYTSIYVVLQEIVRATMDIIDPNERYRIANEFMAWHEIKDEDWQLFLKQISGKVFSRKKGESGRSPRIYFSYHDIRSESHDFEEGSEFDPFLKVSALKKITERKSSKKTSVKKEREQEQRHEKPFVAHDAKKMLDVPEIEYFPEPRELIRATDEWSEQRKLSWAEALKQVLDDRKIFGKHRLILIYGIERILRERRKLEAEKAKKREQFKAKMTASPSFTEKIQETYKDHLEKSGSKKKTVIRNHYPSKINSPEAILASFLFACFLMYFI